MLLVNNRRRASHRFKDAQKKERDYKTKKRSARARANYAEAVGGSRALGERVGTASVPAGAC